ncbi:acyl-CoA thioesterase [Mycobacterium sp. PSTR-4-N]|uniref:acyl-CoA thioesterase n=1 Tax=Mycobacterium sp. PSTR-4-N TaxID=2917745 RepID=UPI001F152324|nr:acyl-CoA thioesterase [Mycobacterium sp. PSTR-4-N]MCG7597298.1 acyl-CoA thioesterase [Mycobacterium sp. PSTR-4-N]
MTFEQSTVLRATIPLRYGDVDRQGHVNNSSVLQIVESARIALWKRAGLPESPGQVIRQQAIEYLAPIHAGHDVVVVEHWCARIGRTSYVLEFRVLDRDGGTFCRGSVVLVAVDAVGIPHEIPPTLRSILESLAGATGRVPG